MLRLILLVVYFLIVRSTKVLGTHPKRSFGDGSSSSNEPLGSFLPQQCSRIIYTLRLPRRSTLPNHLILSKKLVFSF